jgi:signal transduction histidine kinase
VTSGEPLIVSDSRENDLVRDNLAVAELGVIAYAGMPLRDPDGNALGSFCTIDTEPREWSAQDLEVLRYLADAATTEMHLRATVQQLQRTSRLKDQLIGLVSHELRTPISGILGTLRVLEMELAPGQDPQMLDMALESAERLLRLTNGLLHLEQIESGRMEMTPERVAVATLFNAARGSMAEGARTAGIELAFASADAFVHTHVHADCDRITQVFNNLIGNAIKFSPAGSTITVSATPRAGAVSFAVRDQGRGIPALKLERIFDRFSQVEADDKHVLGGAGLGLAVCRAIVEQHGGRIWAENLASGGAEFRFELPAAP